MHSLVAYVIPNSNELIDLYNWSSTHFIYFLKKYNCLLGVHTHKPAANNAIMAEIGHILFYVICQLLVTGYRTENDEISHDIGFNHKIKYKNLEK